MADITELMELNGIKSLKAPNTVAALSAKLDALLEFQGLTVRKIGEGAYEVIKSTEHPSGDYLNPIPYKVGDSVEVGLWYTTEDGNIWEAIKTGVPRGWDDRIYFDII